MCVCVCVVLEHQVEESEVDAEELFVLDQRSKNSAVDPGIYAIMHIHI